MNGRLKIKMFTYKLLLFTHMAIPYQQKEFHLVNVGSKSMLCQPQFEELSCGFIHLTFGKAFYCEKTLLTMRIQKVLIEIRYWHAYCFTHILHDPKCLKSYQARVIGQLRIFAKMSVVLCLQIRNTLSESSGLMKFFDNQ